MSFGRKFRNCIQHFGKNYKDLKLKEILGQNTKEFCSHTTLHGIKYVADNKLRPGERCFFGISIIMVVCVAVYLTARTYDKWSTTPIIVGINPEPTFIANIPFPAVTICNLNQALQAVARTFSKNSTEYTMLQLLCKRDNYTYTVKSITNWIHVKNFIVNISQPCEDMFIDCRFGGKYYNCSSLFFPLVTDEGLCCIFNMLHPKFMYATHISPDENISKQNSYTAVDWYSEAGYPDNLPPLFYPSKIPGVGESLGLSVAIDVQQDKYYCSSSNSVGFKFALHCPNETPNVHETGVYIEPGKETKLRIRPDKTESDQHLRSIDRKYRQCLFHDEGKLKFFAHYTQRNCERECVAEMSLKYCGCISYSMPKIYNNVTVCSINEAHCVRVVRFGMDNSSVSCLDDCLPSCFEMNYYVDAFATKLAHSGSVISNSNLEKMNRSYVVHNIAVVHMFFKDNSFRSQIQNEFIGFSDFLSSIGGLMGLFIGFSFLSIVECIYYAIIRPCRSVRQYQKSIDLEMGSLPKMPSVSDRSTKKRSLLKRHHLSTSKVINDQNQLFEKQVKVPYSIAYGFDVPVEEGITYPYRK